MNDELETIDEITLAKSYHHVIINTINKLVKRVNVLTDIYNSNFKTAKAPKVVLKKKSGGQSE